jgi:hypothetical protein
MIVLRERREGQAERFEDALKDAKRGIKEACEIFEDMKEQFSDRGSYGERYSSRGYYNRDGAGMGADGGQGGGMSARDWDDYEEYKRYKERGRDSMGRYR